MTMVRLDRAACPSMLRPLSLEVAAGALTVVLGPNGAGKTTLLRLALGLVRPGAGRVTIDGVDAHRVPAAVRARALAYMPQAPSLAWPQKVRDVVALGRFAHGGVPGRLGGRDADAVEHAIVACDLATLADRATDTLSGGELARVHCARALAGEAALIVADEPVAALDPRHQHHILRLLRGHVERGGGALVVLHDLSLAARYADRLIWLDRGALVADGSVADTMTAARIGAIYGVEASVTASAVTIGGPLA